MGSLENFLISDVVVNVWSDNKITFCTDTIQVKLCDFGLSEMFEAGNDFRSNKFCGKTNYRSPEINKKVIFCAKSNDIWCLGICLFMLLIGRSPWSTAIDSDPIFAAGMKG